MPLFFGLKRPIEATVDIVALTGVTGYLTYIWSQVDPVAAWGIAPYLGWLGFATYLSVSTSTAPRKVVTLMAYQAGTGYLNNWNMADKEVKKNPAAKGSSKYVNEEDKAQWKGCCRFVNFRHIPKATRRATRYPWVCLNGVQVAILSF